MNIDMPSALFDVYAFKARFLPVTVVLNPIFCLLYVAVPNTSVATALVVVSLPFLTYALANLLRDKGNSLERSEGLLKDLDYVRSHIECYRLDQRQVEIFAEQYRSIRNAATILSEDSVVFDRNCIYGFRRNLRAARPFFSCSAIVALIGLCIIAVYDTTTCREVAMSAFVTCVSAGLACHASSMNSLRDAQIEYVRYLIMRGNKVGSK